MSKYMKQFLDINLEKVKKMTEIKKDYLEGKRNFEKTVSLVESSFETITPEEFAYSEQEIKELGFDDEVVHDKMNNLLDIFKSKIVQVEKKLPKGHPIMTYREENDAIKSVIKEMKEEAIKNNQERFIKNRWLELYTI